MLVASLSGWTSWWELPADDSVTITADWLQLPAVVDDVVVEEEIGSPSASVLVMMMMFVVVDEVGVGGTEMAVVVVVVFDDDDLDAPEAVVEFELWLKFASSSSFSSTTSRLGRFGGPPPGWDELEDVDAAPVSEDDENGWDRFRDDDGGDGGSDGGGGGGGGDGGGGGGDDSWSPFEAPVDAAEFRSLSILSFLGHGHWKRLFFWSAICFHKTKCHWCGLSIARGNAMYVCQGPPWSIAYTHTYTHIRS